MPTVYVNDIEVHLDEHERLNGIQAARRAGVEIPYYCWHPGLTVVASCRMCLVETGTRDPQTGEVKMLPKLVPACQTPAKDGTVFLTETPKVRQSRAFVEEGLLLDHPIDCPICDKAGECYLQDYHFRHGQAERRADVRPFTSRKRVLGPTVTLFVDRCVMCSRCVRFCREVSGSNELMVVHRGSAEEIDVFPEFPLDNKLSGNVVDLCPVGALADRDFLYQQRVWFMRSHPHVCTGCATGCSIWVDENQDRIYRLRPRENPHINQWWMCDEGRYGWHHVHSEKRLVEARRRRAASAPWEPVEWSDVLAELPGVLREASRLAAVLSPHLTVEEAYLLARLVRSVDPEAVLALGPVPVVGDDEHYPGKFTIRAEKCPNRRGVVKVLEHFGEFASTLDDLAARCQAEGVRAVWFTGGYKRDWIDAATAARFQGLDALIVQDMFHSPLVDYATHLLPGASFAEREGSFVNAHDRLQSVAWAIRPPVGVRPEGSVYWRLSGREGLYQARRVLEEVAAEIPYFSAAAGGVHEQGVNLRVNLLA